MFAPGSVQAVPAAAFPILPPSPSVDLLLSACCQQLVKFSKLICNLTVSVSVYLCVYLCVCVCVLPQSVCVCVPKSTPAAWIFLDCSALIRLTALAACSSLSLTLIPRSLSQCLSNCVECLSNLSAAL